MDKPEGFPSSLAVSGFRYFSPWGCDAVVEGFAAGRAAGGSLAGGIREPNQAAAGSVHAAPRGSAVVV